MFSLGVIPHTVKPRACIILLLCALPLSSALSQAPLFFTEHGYLGIPDSERYPDSTHQPITPVRERRYYTISPVETTDTEHFQKTLKFSEPLYVAKKDGYIYYSTEMRGDFVRLGDDARAWVTILRRHRYKP